MARRIFLVGILLTSRLLVSSADERTQNVDNQKSSNGVSENVAPLSKSPLIDPVTLNSQLQNKGIVLLDMGPQREQYNQGHIPGAHFVHWLNDITDPKHPERYNIIDKTTIESLLSRLGVTQDSAIVIYDDLNSRLSTRVYWTLKFYGHEHVYILDGGRAAWIRKQYSLSQDKPSVTPTNYRVRKTNAASRVELAFVADQIKNKNARLIDGRPAKQFTGEEPGKVFHTGTAHKNRGHIPGAVNVFWKDNFNEDGTFKTVDELRQLYAKNGIHSDQSVVTYCNEGLHAAPPWFVLKELLGFENVSLYDDSMSEWANSDQPIETSEIKNP